MTGIRVFLIDDHALVRRGLRAFIDELPDMRVVGEAERGDRAIDQLRTMAEDAVDVVLTDLQMPGMDGIETIRAIKEFKPGIEVIVLTSFSGVDQIQSALEVGASGYLLKDSPPDDLARAIDAALSGELHLDPSVARKLARTLVAPELSTVLLTDRERDVVRLIGEGSSNQEIADALFISERTARTHVSNILMKLGLKSRTQAAIWAIREGIATL